VDLSNCIVLLPSKGYATAKFALVLVQEFLCSSVPFANATHQHEHFK